ncbi:MAG: YdeI/OmpD-associated family protein [Proteobacteria bacterium]|nr:YdeI/OmpD-associated family protein [Burkholderiales bacterium]
MHALTREAWRAWLAANHRRARGVWVITYKKASGKPAPGYDALVEEALCFGWIDSKPNKVDAARTKLWFAPRKTGTGWSRPNKQRVERMIEAGLMMSAGLAKVEAARRDGSWSALDAIEALELPTDLVAALANAPGATAHFGAFPRSAKRGILEWIATAQRPETRARRIDETARLAARNERANQWAGGAHK